MASIIDREEMLIDKCGVNDVENRKTANKKSRASSGTMVLTTDLTKVSVAFSAGPGIMQIIRQGGKMGRF